MGHHVPLPLKNPFFRYLMQLTPAARLGLIVFLLALAMVAAGLGIRSVTPNHSPVQSSEPPLMVYQEIAPPAALHL